MTRLCGIFVANAADWAGFSGYAYLDQVVEPPSAHIISKWVMYGWHGHEKVLQVLNISMPSTNVVSLHCTDGDGCHVHVAGHMHSVNFFTIHTIVPPPAVRVPIGFVMPQPSTNS